MASAPQQPTLPLFYNDLMPLNSRDHSKWHARSIENAKFISTAHAIPITIEEFVQAQRNYPIVFSSGENALPLALMGLNEGVNTFVDAEGKINEPVYLPAYIRRYPFMLAKLTQDGDELSLCFDPTSGAVGDFAEGEPLFDGDQPSDNTKNILNFCEQFEAAAQRTKAFMDELRKADLLMNGEIAIQAAERPDQPFTYRGFQMIDQEKLKNASDESFAAWQKNGMLPLIHAHIFSLDLMRTIFARQVQQGTAPQAFQNPGQAAGEAADEPSYN